MTSIPGTTRDIIEETLNIKGIPVIVSDTAGVHKTENPVEMIGIEKTLVEAAADLGANKLQTFFRTAA